MRHDIPVAEVGPYALPMAEAVEACVHCGFCLPSCPTYQVLEQEVESPRGRIILMKEVLEGSLALADAAPHLDACLGCLACVTACPSGVQYGELLTPFRMQTEPQRKRTLLERALRAAIMFTLPHPKRFRLAARLGRLARPFRQLLPARFLAMLQLLPERLPEQVQLQEHYRAVGEHRATVALLAGCAQQVLEPEINLATINVLVNNGVEVLVPRSQGCCGALAAHTGVQRQAQSAARRNLRVFPEGVTIISNAAGCGSGLLEYPLWLRGEPEEDSAARFSARVQDIAVFLAALGLRPPSTALERPLRVAYQDACHLEHGQGVTLQPRELLRQIPGVELIELQDRACCGSAGTYNIEQPATAAELGRRKAAAVLATGADVVVTGNIGCLQQLVTYLPERVPVLHTMQLLARIYR